MKLSSAAVLVIASILIALGAVGSVAQETRIDRRLDDREYEELLRKMTPPGSYSPEVLAIRNLMAERNFESAWKLCEELLARPIAEFDNEYYGYNVKANAYNYKASILQRTGGAASEIVNMTVSAMRLGHVEAARYFAENVLRRQPDFTRYIRGIDRSELTTLFRIGADMGEPFSSAAIGLTNLPFDIDPDEKVFWRMMTIIRDGGKSKSEKEELFSREIKANSEDALKNIFKKYALTGVPASSKLGIPSRGLLEALFAESDLRGSLGKAHGNKRDFKEKPPLAPTIREQFDFYSRIVPEVGYGDVFLTVVGSTRLSNPRIISATPAQVLDELVPGDRVFVSCGPISHVAFYFGRESETKSLLFVDPNYEFWRPSVNSCITSFRFVEWSHKRYLSAIKEDEVQGIITAVITMRDAR